MPEIYREIDLRTASDPSGNHYFIVFCSRDSDGAIEKPGHAFVVWGKEDEDADRSSEESFGFYPADDNSLNAVLGTVPGELRDEALQGIDSDLLTACLFVRLDRDPFDVSQGNISDWETGDYNLYRRNCISFVEAVARDVSLDPPDVDAFELPEEYLRHLVDDVELRSGDVSTVTESGIEPLSPSIRVESVGTLSGEAFPIQSIASLGFRSGRYVDAVELNGRRYGGGGGSDTGVFELGRDEYINYFRAQAGGRGHLRFVEVRTNSGIRKRAGTIGGPNRVISATKIRLLGLGGNHAYVDPFFRANRLRFRYISDYREPEIIERNQLAIIGVITPGETFERSASGSIHNKWGYKTTMERTFSRGGGLNLGVKIGDFTAKASADLKMTTSSSREFVRQIEKEFNESTKETFKPNPGEAGVYQVLVDVFRDTSDGFVWVYPIAEAELVSVALSPGPADPLYDLTGAVGTQFPAVREKRADRHGLIYYDI